MMKTFEKCNAQDVIIKRFNSVAIDVRKLDCDFYLYLANDERTKRTWLGEFMSEYEWAEHVAGYLDRAYNN